MKKIKLIALFGESGAGKDTILQLICAEDPHLFYRVVTCTTRPKRDGEIEGVDYYFVSDEEFAAMAYEEKLVEAMEFNGWFYGTPITSLIEDKINVGVFSPEGIGCLLDTADEYDITVLPIYVSCLDKVRLIRVLNREEDPDVEEIIRRYQTDKTDFSHIFFSYLTVYNDSEPIESNGIVKTIVNYSKDFFD